MHDIFTHNRVILTHFDSYSVALLFPRWDNNTLLWPQPLPESASPMPTPIAIAPKAAIQALGGEFKPMSLLRGSTMSELLLLREVFNLIVGGG